MKSTKLQIKDSNNWNSRNKARHRVYAYRSTTRNFIKNYATSKDLYRIIALAQMRLDKQI